MFRSIKTPLIALTLLSLLVVTVAVSMIAFSEYEESAKEGVDAMSQNLSDDLLGMLSGQPDEFELTTLLLRLDRVESVKNAFIFNKDWSLLSSYQGQAGDDLPLNIQDVTKRVRDMPLGLSNQDDELVVVKMIGDERLPLGYLHVVHDLSQPADDNRRKLFLRIAPLAALVGLATLGIVFWLLETWVRPLTRLSNFVTKVGKTQDYGLRPKQESYYELARLSRDIGSMMDRIEDESNKNSQYTRQLIEQQAAMEKLANYDALTGLPNRKYFVENLKQALENAEQQQSDLALLFLDLDGFKGVNDTFGHEMGDRLLVQIAERLGALVREDDFISRLGGDEFLVLLGNNPNEFLIASICESIIFEVQQSAIIDDIELKVGASIGVAMATQSDFEISEFMSNADLAMYRSKLEGKGRYTMFVESMMQDNKRKLKLASKLEAVIENNRLKLFYQPRVNTQGQVVAFEALVRWLDEEMGFVSPAEFIPIAEQSGKITALTLWVVNQACQDFSELQHQFGEQINLSINLSANDVAHPNLLEKFTQIMSRHNMMPQSLEFELTESAYLENFQVANRFIDDIREIGCQIALDDFGTGYSSLAYLTQINIDTLKIDKQFIDHLNESQRTKLITRSIIEMANGLQLSVCAEGIEEQAQADFLIDAGCQQLQGYYYAKPAPLNKINQSLRTG